LGEAVLKTLGFNNSGNSAFLASTLVDGDKVSQFGVAEWLRRQVVLHQGVSRTIAVNSATEVLEWLGKPAQLARIVVERIVDLLIDTGDIGQGTAFGQPFLLSMPRRAVVMPSGNIALLGGADFPSRPPTHPLALFPHVQTSSDLSEVDILQELGRPRYELEGVHYPELKSKPPLATDGEVWSRFASEWSRVSRTGRGSLDTLPRQLRKAVALCGLVDVELEQWELRDEAVEFLNLWLGTAEVPENNILPSGFDPEQHLIVTASAHARLVVEAGPGTGKTHVAIGRIARLIDQGVPASRIWLLSFTRVAVEEMRNRVSEKIANGAASALNVATFDSFAWRLNTNFDHPGLSAPASYDQAISKTIKLLAARDTALEDFLGTIEHVIIDEAQDLVGSRKEMVSLFLDCLSSHCGITVLGDFAQSIYGWQETSAAPTKLLQDMLAQREHSTFQKVRLSTDHRTDNPKLSRMFTDARETLRRADLLPQERYERIRMMIEEVADVAQLGSLESVAALSGRSLVLFRGRKPLLATTHALAKRGIRFRIKLSNRSEIVAPWIGAVFAGLGPAVRINRADFDTLFEDAGVDPIDLDRQTAWDELRSISEEPGATISVAAVCSRVERNLPVRFLSDHFGTQGPVFSTIHGSKGKEADKVFMFLPARPNPDIPDTDWDEEARILYVGATRAKRQLLIGSRRSGYMRPAPSGRMWRGRREDFSAEIGLPGDVVPAAHITDISITRAAVLRLVGIKDVPISCIGRRQSGDQAYELVVTDAESGEVAVGYLTDEFANDLARIGGCRRSDLPDLLSGFFVVGGTTVVWKAGPDRAVNYGLALAPVLMGFVQIQIGASE
jgi:DNA helicase II / ATP-dependent DNA helicase PcrA